MKISVMADPIGFDDLLARLALRDRRSIEQHVAVCESEPTPEHVILWKRLACSLASIAPAIETAGQRAVRFFVPDGIYRMQLFALEDLRDGNISVYAVDALQSALRSGVLRGPLGANSESNLYQVCAEPTETLKVEILAAATTTLAPNYYRHLLGWRRQAIKITLPTIASEGQVRGSEAIYALGAQQAQASSQEMRSSVLTATTSPRKPSRAGL